MSIATITDIEFVTQLRAATEEDGGDWPTPANAAQVLAMADYYGSDGASGTVYGEPEMDALIVALCVLAKAYREAVL